MRGAGRSGAGRSGAGQGDFRSATQAAEELVPGFSAETDLERRVAADPELVRGFEWGEPRAGHPEGTVASHVADLLETIEDWGEIGERRSRLRFLALVHDSLKYHVDQSRPKTGENHHAMRARRFAEGYTQDESLLCVLELHDRPYQLWRRLQRTRRLQQEEFQAMMRRVPDPELFLRFVELDGSTAGKDPKPIRWFRSKLEARGIVSTPRSR